MNELENGIINAAKNAVETKTASELQKVIAKMYDMLLLQESIDKVYNKIKPINIDEIGIEEIFQNYENSLKKLFDTLYDYCGSSYIYTCDTIIDYTECFLMDKIKLNNKYLSLRRLFILITCRKYMEEDKWYSINDIIDLIYNADEYDIAIPKQNINLLMKDCVEKGYFVEKDRECKMGTVGRLYFKKTDKKFDVI